MANINLIQGDYLLYNMIIDRRYRTMRYSFEGNIDTVVFYMSFLGYVHIKDCLSLLNSDPIKSKYY